MCPHIPLKERSEIRKVMLQKWRYKKRMYSIFSQFPKDRNCDICLRTQVTVVPCRRRNEGSIPRADKFGDFATADHKVLNEGSESWNNHRFAVMVQDLATQWVPSLPCKNKNSQETVRSLRKFPEPSQKPKVIKTDNSLEFGKSCEEISWNRRRNVQDFLADGKTPYERRFGESF